MAARAQKQGDDVVGHWSRRPRGAGVGCKLGEAFGAGCDHTVGKNKARSGGDVSPGDAFSMYNIKKEFRCC